MQITIVSDGTTPHWVDDFAVTCTTTKEQYTGPGVPYHYIQVTGEEAELRRLLAMLFSDCKPAYAAKLIERIMAGEVIYDYWHSVATYAKVWDFTSHAVPHTFAELANLALDYDLLYTEDFSEFDEVLDPPEGATAVVYQNDGDGYIKIHAFTRGDEVFRYGYDSLDEDEGEEFPTTFKELRKVLDDQE